MKPAMSVMSLLLLLLLLANKSKGTRLLEGESLASLHKEVHKESLVEDGSGIGGGLLCGSHRHCSGKSRKLMTNAMATSKNDRSNDMSVDGSAGNNHEHSKGEVERSQEDLHTTPPAANQGQTNPNILDIAGMDYSPAQRKPPIHN